MDKHNPAQTKLRIGEVASQAGVNVQTLRYYERVGLIEKPERRDSGHREYSQRTVEKIRLIKSAQALGYSLKEIESLLRLSSDRAACTAALTVAEAQLREINDKIRSLQALKASIEAVIMSCGCMAEDESPSILCDETEDSMSA